MYTKQQASLVRQEFWTAFGKYMQPVPSAEGVKVNWVNYKTGVKQLAFKMHAVDKIAYVAVEILHKDPAIQQLFFEKFQQFEQAFFEAAGNEWQWQLHVSNDHGKTISRIYKQLDNVNVLNKQHWPTLISFFKTNIMALDQFWSQFKFAFEDLTLRQP